MRHVNHTDTAVIQENGSPAPEPVLGPGQCAPVRTQASAQALPSVEQLYLGCASGFCGPSRPQACPGSPPTPKPPLSTPAPSSNSSPTSMMHQELVLQFSPS